MMNMQYAEMVFAHEKAHREWVHARFQTADHRSTPAPAAVIAAGTRLKSLVGSAR